MPAKPSWYSHLPKVIDELERLNRPFVDRATLQTLLGVGRRRAQEILAPCVTDRVGANGLADREALILHLRHVAEGEHGYYEKQRQRKVSGVLAALRKERLERPQLLVAAPVSILNQELTDLPAGVRLESGRITVEFEGAQQALEKLLAIAMAVANNFESFERQVRSAQD